MKFAWIEEMIEGDEILCKSVSNEGGTKIKLVSSAFPPLIASNHTTERPVPGLLALRYPPVSSGQMATCGMTGAGGIAFISKI